jgi:hypothetical protein
MSCPCCLQTPCVSLCRMPQELEATIVSNGVTATLELVHNCSRDIAAIEGFIEGTYSLTVLSIISPGSDAEYAYLISLIRHTTIPWGLQEHCLAEYRWFCTSCWRSLAGIAVFRCLQYNRN